jgi:hypothetical protein
MLVFIDESGDPGLNIEGGSSKYFVVAHVAFDDHDEALAADDRISRLRKEQGFPAKFEFHFNKMRPAYRRRFLEAVASYNFFYFAVVMNKAKLTDPEFQFKESIYKYACGLLLEDAKPRLNNAIVVVDGSESKSFRRELKSYLVRKLKDHSGNLSLRTSEYTTRQRTIFCNWLIWLWDLLRGLLAERKIRANIGA